MWFILDRIGIALVLLVGLFAFCRYYDIEADKKYVLDMECVKVSINHPFCNGVGGARDACTAILAKCESEK